MEKAQTRAEKKDAVKKIILQLVKKNQWKSNALIDEAAKIYALQVGGDESENPNDVKGRIGSVLDVMKKEGEVLFEGNMYATKPQREVENAVELRAEKAEEKPKKTTRSKAKKAQEEKVQTATMEETVAEKPKKTTRARKGTGNGEKAQPLPSAPVLPIAPVAPITPESAPEPIPESAPKKRTRKAKATPGIKVKTEEVAKETASATPVVVEVESKALIKKDEPKGMLMDMSFLFGDVKPAKKVEQKEGANKIIAPLKEKAPTQSNGKEGKNVETISERKIARKVTQSQPRTDKKGENTVKKARSLTADEKLQEAFIKKLHRLGGEYFEYYSVYLLERYSKMNGRRLESLKITGGDHDGGIDGEIELTDRLGFRETIYIQAKNWDPDKGDEKLWVVGETLLQQFIGACVCRQAKDGKQNSRGIFITTSRFTPEAKRILEDTADKFVGYDANDLYEAAKECSFGVVKKNGEWTLDEELLAGEKAFFKMF